MRHTDCRTMFDYHRGGGHSTCALGNKKILPSFQLIRQSTGSHLLRQSVVQAHTIDCASCACHRVCDNEMGGKSQNLSTKVKNQKIPNDRQIYLNCVFVCEYVIIHTYVRTNHLDRVSRHRIVNTMQVMLCENASRAPFAHTRGHPQLSCVIVTRRIHAPVGTQQGSLIVCT